ncbi:CxxxxCH/CxxCH domain c-type cytochrome [Deferrisoma camini]|uniref:CxxxxCH/CxxCH domain c-type cytochrome n=1 Tax=Deferrisoma camini TaxID=1035120 RepID=UPI000A01CDED|nr:CxxxxCH/CxxCH domain-containing protein [Deferrisoma camini]
MSRRFWVGAIVVGWMLWAGPALATHYPPGALCYDCHAVSAGKMVAGTHLLRASQKTIDLGITDTDPTVRCLFCHEENAVSVQNRDRMKGVYHDFDATSLSKHPVDVTKGTFAQDSTAFDCLDCHTVSGMTADGAGNANIHGVDASQTTLAVNTTLIGNPADLSDAELSTKTCQNTNCHSATGTTLNGYSAPPAHGADNTKITLNDVAVAENPIYCTRCHGKHNSVDGERLLVLQNTSGHSGQPATNQTVNLTECDVCHTKDENGGLTDNYGLYGHGKMGVGCDTCHELSHDVDGDGVFDPAPRLKATLAEDTTAGTSSFGTNFYSNCRHCHAGHAPHTPTPADGGDAGTGRSAGCLDCHDQHGTTAADSTFQNDTMIRRMLAGEDTQLPDDDVKYNGDWYLFGATNGTCDNTACHSAIPSGQSLNDNGAGGTNHLGGPLTSTTCASGTGCHDGHSSSTNFAAAQACDTCHGFPPSASDTHPDNPDAVGVHDTHVNKMGYGCSECHYGNNHNQSGWGSDQGTAVPSANVEVAFNPAFNPDGTYDTGTNTCSNLTCHNPDDPTIGITGKGDGGQTTRSAPVWIDAYKTTASTETTRNGYPANGGTWEIGDTGEECEACHLNSLSSNPDGGNHYAHDNPTAPQKNYPCRTCHAGEDSTNNAYSPDHAKGSLTDPALVNFDLSQAGLPVTGTETFTNASSTCTNVYCHGATLNNGGVTQSPVWTDDTTGDCGTCHGVFGDPANASVPEKAVTSNNHPTHYTAAHGPAIVEGHGGTAPGCSSCHNSIADFSADCSPCHGSGSEGALGPGATTPSPTHVDGNVDFVGDVQLAATSACDNCHSTASINGQVGRDLAKSYWATTNTIPCVNCHNGTDPGTSLADGTGRTAPDVLGDDTTYGAEVTGHNLASGTYAGSGNPAAAKVCDDCHDTASTHVNNADDTTFAGNRLRATVNTVATGSTVSGLCGACHQTTVGTPAQAQVSSHGNLNTSFTSGTTHDANAESFAYNCEACHEPHGLTQNTGGNANIYMIRPSVEIKNYSEPTTGADRTTTVSVVFEAKTGTNSFDDGLTQNDNMCVACHIDANRPGSSTAMTNTDGNHIELNDYTSNEQGNDCTGCHSHDYDSDAGGTADGFMPLQCDGCHGFPPATNAHAKHVTTAGFDCGKCHQNAGTHNETGVTNATEFNNLMSTSPGTIRNNVDVVFDALNPNGTYSLAKGSRPNDTTTYGTCTTLYCHGDDAATFPANNGGSDTTPEWNNASTGACGTCHGATAAVPPRSNAHLKHTSANEYGYGCNLCHVATTPDGSTLNYPTHANGAAEVAFDTSDPRLDANSTYNGDTAVGSGYGACTQTYCHSQGNDRVPPFGEFTYTRQKGVSGTWTPITWDNPNGSCSKCHGSRPDYADLQDIDGTPKGNKHEKHVGENLYSDCGACHYTTVKGKGGGFNPATHVNMQYNVDVDPALTTADLGYFTFTAGTGGVNGTCSTANCHGGRSNVAWDYDVATNGNFTCDVCHATTGGAAATADVNDFLWDNTGAQSKINQTDYNSSGHGAKGLACAACHDSTVPHNSYTQALQPHTLDGTNPFRLKDQDTGTAGVQFSCSYTGTGCHASGTIGPATGLDISTFKTHSSAEMSNSGYTPKYTWSFAPECVNCHDPHGDGSNLSMVQRELYDKAQFGLPAGPPPAEPTEQTGLAFTDDTTGQSTAGTSYADSDAPYSSICQECHEGTPGTDTPYVFVDDTSASGGSHPGGTGNPGDCSDCHPHNKAFSPSCTGCHGDPAAGTYWPDGTATPDRAGRHAKHISRIAGKLGYASPYTDAQQKEMCAYCHEDPRGSSFATLHNNGTANVTGYVDPIWTTIVVGTESTDTDAAYDNVADTCATVDCHNNKLTTDNTFGWYDTGTSTCTMCHTPGGHAGGFANPTTGLHDVVPTVSGVQHDDSFPYNGGTSTADCTTCHTTTPSSAHMDGTADLSAPTIQFAADVGFTDGTPPTCAPSLTGCHLEQTVGESWSRLWHENAAATTGAECAGCHGDWTNGWNAGVTHRTDSGPRAHATGTNYECKDCHALEASTGYMFTSGTGDWNQASGETSNHGNAQITLNSNGTSFARDGAGLSGCSACHAAYDGAVPGKHSFVTTAWTLETVSGDVPSVNCGSCHDDGGASGAPQVNATSSHTDADGAGTTWAAGDCSACHKGHVGAAGGVDIPLPPTSWNNRSDGSGQNLNMQTQLGIDYTSHGGIHLGGSATSGTTEAEICWNCHDSNGVSEWGVNNNANTGGLSYDYGSLDVSNWTIATWTSAVPEFSYKTAAIQSTHSVNFTNGTAAVSGTPYATGGMSETVDNVADIRCSYCHDVHDLNKASGDTVSGQPYLRGTWKGNPYNEDGAPQSSMDGNWTGTNRYGFVPRGSADPNNNNGVGGYWIDQNSGNPNNGETLSTTAGLCTLCHGTDVDNMDYTTGEGLWVGTNGHSNAVIGGTGAQAVNIFRNTWRGGNAKPAGSGSDQSMGLAEETGRGYSYRGSWGYGYNPPTNPASRAYAYKSFEWGTSAGGSTPKIATGTVELTVDDTTLQIQFHTFNCGKCHNPHASRLPKLMITNCLDTNHNTWQDLYQIDTNSGSLTNGERLANWTTSQNCHRRGPAEATGAGGSGTKYGPGWNKVTPW